MRPPFLCSVKQIFKKNFSIRLTIKTVLTIIRNRDLEIRESWFENLLNVWTDLYNEHTRRCTFRRLMKKKSLLRITVVIKQDKQHVVQDEVSKLIFRRNLNFDFY